MAKLLHLLPTPTDTATSSFLHLRPWSSLPYITHPAFSSTPPPSLLFVYSTVHLQISSLPRLPDPSSAAKPARQLSTRPAKLPKFPAQAIYLRIRLSLYRNDGEMDVCMHDKQPQTRQSTVKHSALAKCTQSPLPSAVAAKLQSILKS